MYLLFFWKKWEFSNKWLYISLLAGFLITLIGYLFAFFYGADAVLDWQVQTTLESLQVTAGQFNAGLFNLSFPVDNFLVRQQIQGTPVDVNFEAAYIYLVLLGIGIVFGLSIITYFKRFWYFLGVIVFVGLLVSFKLEQLQLFGLVNKIPLIIAFLVFLPATYFFHSLQPHRPLLLRLVTFAILTLVFGFLIGSFSEVDYPFLFLAHYGLVGPLLITIFVIFLVAHEIVYFFLRLITSGSSFQAKNSNTHFTILTGFYLLNVLFTYLNNTGMMSWNIIYINAFLLFACSLLVGIFGFRDSEELYGEIIPFRPYGGLLYLSLGIISMAVIIFCMANANDPMVEVFEDAIIYSHFAFGLTFFLYVMYNFFSMMAQNQEVHKIVYRPQYLPYFFTKIAGIIIIGAFFLRSDMFPFYQGIAGYYNGVGDVYLAQKDYFSAEQYYKLANQYEFQNHRSNYSLATLANRQGDISTAVYYYKQSLRKNPTQYAYINLANTYSNNGNYFDALFTLREGLKEFPGNGRMQNNIGLLFSKTSVIDSAFYFLNAARSSDQTKKIGETNLIGLIAKNNLATQQRGIIQNPDKELPELLSQNDYLAARVNAQALINQQNLDTLKKFQALVGAPEPRQYLSGTLGQVDFAWLFNGIFNQRNTIDSLQSTRLDSISRLTSNPNFQRSLGFLTNITFYEQTRLGLAIEGVEELLIADRGKSGYYNQILGYWALEQNAPLLASEYYGRAKSLEYPGAGFNQAIALSEASRYYPNEKNRALNAWRNILSRDTAANNSRTSRAARDLIHILEGMHFDSLLASEDPIKYMHIRYKGWNIPGDQLRTLVNAFNNDIYRDRAIINLLEPLLENNNDSLVLNRVVSLRRMVQSESPVFSGNKWPWIEARLLVKQNKVDRLEERLEQLNPHTPLQKTQKAYFQAVIASARGNRQTAEKYFQVVTNNPFFEPGILAATNFYREQLDKPMLAYNTLLSAIRINKYAVPLLKNYILLSLDMGMDQYAADVLMDLKSLISPAEFNKFNDKYDQKREALADEEW